MWLIRQIGNFAIAISELWLLGMLRALVITGGVLLTLTIFATALALSLLAETLIMDLVAAVLSHLLDAPIGFDPLHPLSLIVPFAIGLLAAWWPTAAWYQYVRRNWIGRLADRQRRNADDRGLDVYVRLLRDHEWEEWAVQDPELRSLSLLRDGYRCRWCSALCNTVRYWGAPERYSDYVPELPAPTPAVVSGTTTTLEASPLADPALERIQTICRRCFNRLLKS